MGSFFISAILLLLSLFSYLFARKPEPKAKLPPGSMGWPYIGETLQFYSEDPNVFFATKQKRYGEIVKAHLLGCPCVMLASPEASRFVLVTQAHLFKPTYPKSKEQMIGPWALFFHQGDYHGRLRKLIQSLLAPEAIRRLIPEMETIATSMLESWADGLVSSAFEIMKTFSFDIGILAIFGGRLEESYKVELKKNYSILDKGYNSFPFDFPGTSYSKAIKARRRLRETLDDIMNERRKKGTAEKDLLGYLMDSKDEKGDHLSDDQIADNIIGVLFAAQDTTASALTWILKYLHDDSKLIEALEAEHEGGKRPLTWAQTRTMHLTHRVILEGLRMASIISFTFREAVADVEYKGYLIPKGWKVMPLFRNIHHNPDFFLDPHKFEPSRFETPPKPNTFMPFGNGVHACPGNELAKLEMLVLIHHLVTKYRMEVMGSSSEIQYCPFPVPKHGLQARLQRKFITPDASSTAADPVTS